MGGHHGRFEQAVGGPLRQLHAAQQRSAQRCGLRRRGARRLGVGGDRCRRRPARIKTGQWTHFNERNTPMYEIWTYAVTAGAEKVYYAVWGGGVLEYDMKTGAWKDYNDPDGETEMVVLKDQGLIHEITTSVSWAEKDHVLWVATYFGASHYDGRNWKNFLEKDSGLPSNFLNQVKAVDGTRAWFATDKGLAYYDGANWAVYRPALDTHAPEMIVRDAQGAIDTGSRGHGSRASLHSRPGFSEGRLVGGHRPRLEPRNPDNSKRAGTK